MEDKGIRIKTYNCQSFVANMVQINDLLKNCDILFLQETLLREHDFYKAETLNSDFMCANTEAIRGVDTFVGRSSSGLTVFWRNFKDFTISPIYVNPRIMGLKMMIHDITYILLDIYCICDYINLDSLLEYKSLLSELSNYCENEHYDEILIIGDFNCDPHKGRFYSEFQEFFINHDLECVDVSCLQSDSYTYISSNNTASTSWLDHILSSNYDIVQDLNIMYGFSFDDHIPVEFKLKIPIPVNRDNVAPDVEILPSVSYIRWDNVSDDDIEIYQDNLDDHILNFWDDVLSCNRPNCKSEEHHNLLDNIYVIFGDLLVLCSDHFKKSVTNANFKVVPGWILYCQDLYKKSRECFLKWHNGGRIRSDIIFENMKSSRKVF